MESYKAINLYALSIDISVQSYYTTESTYDTCATSICHQKILMPEPCYGVTKKTLQELKSISQIPFTAASH